MADQQVSVEWARIGKEPGTLAYRVLATSTGDTDFGGYVGRYATGSPDRSQAADAPGAPPWVTFGPLVTPADDTLVSVSVQEPAQDRDHSGRPISPERLFLVRYSDLASVGASYQRLWNALRDIPLPTADHLPLTITLGHQPAEDLVKVIERYGIERMTALAAMILEDRIVLADSAALRRGERLAVLDAAAALLPYGFRAAVSASSAVNNTVTHVIDLVFAEFANEANNQTIVQLSASAPIPVPKTKLGRAYQDLLREKVRTPGLQAVVEHLWQARAACSLQHQEAALQIIGELDFDGSLRRALRDGTATRAQLRTFFSRDPAAVQSSWRSPAMDEPMRRHALQLLLDRQDSETPGLLVAHWPTVADDLVAAASDSLDAGEMALAARCLRLARLASADAEDYFLKGLLTSGQAAPGSRPRRLAALVRLLDERETPGPGALPFTWEHVARDVDERWQSQLFRRLLAGQMLRGDRHQAMAWASWICPPGPAGSPPWAAGLRVAVRPDAGAAAGSVLDPGDSIWAGIVLRAATFAGRLPQALSAVLNDLLNLAASVARESAAEPGRPAAKDPDAGFLLDSLDIDLWRAAIPADTVAVADLTRLLLGGRPRDFPATIDDGRVLDSYGDGLIYVLSLGLPQWRPWLVRRFLRQVVPGRADRALSNGGVWLLNSWAADPELSPEVARHVAGMDEAGRPIDERLASSYWDAVALTPELAGYATVPRLTAAAREAAADPRTALARRTGPRGVSHTALALTCYSARQAGLPVKEILRVLHRSEAHRISPRSFDDVIREFQGLLYYDPGLSPRATADLFECYEEIACGAFGAEYAARFTRELAARSQDDIRLREKLLQHLTKSRGTTGRNPPGPDRRKPPRSRRGQPPGSGQGQAAEPGAHKPADPGRHQAAEPRARKPADPGQHQAEDHHGHHPEELGQPENQGQPTAPGWIRLRRRGRRE